MLCIQLLTQLEANAMTDAEDDVPDEAGAADPRAKLMEEVASQMDAIETDFGDGYQIGNVVTVVEVFQPDGVVGIRVRCNQQPWIGVGMLRFALKFLEGGVA
jgi:hypothetical protein